METKKELKRELNEILKSQKQKREAEVNLEKCRRQLIKLLHSYLSSFTFTCLDCSYSKGTINFDLDFVDKETVENTKKYPLLNSKIHNKLNVNIVFIDEHELHKAREELLLLKNCYYEKNTAEISIVLKEEVINLLGDEE